MSTNKHYTKEYTNFAFNDVTTNWLQTGYKKKNNLLRSLTSQDNNKLEKAMKEYMDALLVLVENDVDKALESTRYIWTQASAIMTNSGLDDWTINMLNHTYYPLLTQSKNINEILYLCEKILWKYVHAYNQYANTSVHSTLVNNVIHYIKRNLPNHISVEEIADAMHFSVSYVSHTFKNETGKSIGTYIMNEKMKMAKNMIQQSYSLLDISVYLNFSSQSHFTKQFKKQFKMTPNEYRKFIKKQNHTK